MLNTRKKWFAEAKGDALLSRSVVAAEVDVIFPNAFDAAAIEQLAAQYGGSKTHERVSVAPSKLNSQETVETDHKLIACRFPCPSPESIDDLLARLQAILDSPGNATGGEYGIRVTLIAELRDSMIGQVGCGTTAKANEPSEPPAWMTGTKH